MVQIDAAITRVEAGEIRPLYLVTGDRIVAEPVAIRLGQALAKKLGCEPDIVKRPERLAPTLHDLRTFALFATGKVTVVIESSVLADAGTAPSLIDEAIEALPLPSSGADLGPRERRAAACLLKALRLFQLDPYASTAEEVIGQLPAVAFEGGASHRKKTRRRRSRAQVETARDDLSVLLEAARREQIQGIGESDDDVLAEIVRDGLPEGHALVLAESAWTETNPIVGALAAAEAVIETSQVTAGKRSGWVGLQPACDELQRETGVGIEDGALAELARRTLRRRQGRSSRDRAVDSESTARFAAEYRKLANLTSGPRIGLELVQEVIEDRGEEDIWGVLDAVGEGRAETAITGIDRLLHGAENVVTTRLSIFSLLAGFCRQLTAVAGMLSEADVPIGELSYPRFKDRIAPRLQADLDGGRKNPLAGLHPYRLHKVYLAASRLGADNVRRLPARVLDTERRLKGESVAPDSALFAFVSDLARPAG